VRQTSRSLVDKLKVPNRSKKKIDAPDSSGPYHHGSVNSKALKVALELVEAKGIKGLSLREVAAQLKISHVSLYHHFSSKADLLNSLAAEGFQLFAKIFDELQASTETNWKNQFTRLSFRYIEFAVIHKSHYEVMYSKDRSISAPSSEVKLHGDRAAKLFLDFLETGIKLKVLNGDLEFMFVTIWSGLHGASELLTANRLQIFIPQYELERFTNYFSDSLVAKFIVRADRTN